MKPTNPAIDQKSVAQIKFIEWLKRRDPFLYTVVKKSVEMRGGRRMVGNPRGSVTLGGDLGWLESLGTVFSTVASTIERVAPVVLTAVSQKKILDIQMQRAKQGLAPLDAAAYIPSVSTQTMTPQLEAAATQVAQSVPKNDFMPALLLGGGALALIMLIKSK